MLLPSPLTSTASLPSAHLLSKPKTPNFVRKSFQFRRLTTPSSSSRRLLRRANPNGDLLAAPAEDARNSVERSERLEAEGEEREGQDGNPNVEGDRLSVGVGNPSFPVRIGLYRLSLGDQAFFLLAFIACTTSIAFASLVMAAVPTLYAMRRTAISLAKLADTAREELPSTMAAIRLSGMEISDLTLELSDLSQEIADGVSKSAQAVQAAEAGIRQIGTLARRQTISMIQERANLPNISLQPVVTGAAKKTSNVVGQARKKFMNLISRGDHSPGSSEQSSDKVEY